MASAIPARHLPTAAKTLDGAGGGSEKTHLLVPCAIHSATLRHVRGTWPLSNTQVAGKRLQWLASSIHAAQSGPSALRNRGAPAD